MGNWRLGFPDALKNVTEMEQGQAVYGGWSAVPLTLSNREPKRNAGQITGRSSVSVSASGVDMSINDFQYGFIKMLSGNAVGKVFKIASNTTETFIVQNFNPIEKGIETGDYFEVIRGVSTFVFPNFRSPTRKDYKRIFNGNYERLPYYNGGVAVDFGYQKDDFVIRAYVTSWEDWRKLEVLLNTKIAFDGMESIHNPRSSSAPLILEEGYHEADSQYLVYVLDYKIERDGSSGNIWMATIHFINTNMTSFRGL